MIIRVIEDAESQKTMIFSKFKEEYKGDYGKVYLVKRLSDSKFNGSEKFVSYKDNKMIVYLNKSSANSANYNISSKTEVVEKDIVELLGYQYFIEFEIYEEDLNSWYNTVLTKYAYTEDEANKIATDYLKKYYKPNEGKLIKVSKA